MFVFIISMLILEREFYSFMLSTLLVSQIYEIKFLILIYFIKFVRHYYNLIYSKLFFT